MGLSIRNLQTKLDSYRYWYNTHRPHSVLGDGTPEEAWVGEASPKPMLLRARDADKVRIKIRRLRCRGYPRLPVIDIALRNAA